MTNRTFGPEDFGVRLSTLRELRNISACTMSYDLGHNRNYINGIETRHYLPSLPAFFDICEYLNISPSLFFDISTMDELPPPAEISPLELIFDELTPEQSESVYHMIRSFLH